MTDDMCRASNERIECERPPSKKAKTKTKKAEVRTIHRTAPGGASASSGASSVGPAAVADMGEGHPGVGGFARASAEDYVPPVRSDL